MWVNRTEFELEEARRQRRRDRRKGAAWFGVAVFFIATFLFGWREAYLRGRWTVPASELLSRLPYSLFAGVIGGFFIWKFKADREQPMVICTTCETVKTEDGVGDCACGGRFEKLDEIKYVA